MTNELKPKASWWRVRFLLLGIAASTTLSYACGPEWTYIGRPPFEVLCAYSSPGHPENLFAGTYSVPWAPGSGGIYRWTGQDTVWEYIALQDHRVWEIKSFESIPNSLFAVTSEGIYRSDNGGFVWNLASTTTPASYEPVDFTISPFDTAEWAVAQYNFDSNGIVKTSSNSGQSWQYLHFGALWWHLLSSRQTDGLIYFAEGGGFCSVSLADSVVDTLATPGWTVVAIQYHAAQPWIFVLSGHILFRYDEENGSLIEFAFPDSIAIANSMEMTLEGQLLLGTNTGVYLVSDHLVVRERVPGLIGSSYAGHVLYVSDHSWIVAGVGGALYCRGVETEVDPHRSQSIGDKILVFPNPSRGLINFKVPFAARLEIYNLLGQNVVKFDFDGSNSLITWSSPSEASGVYYYRISNQVLKNQPTFSGTVQVLR